MNLKLEDENSPVSVACRKELSHYVVNWGIHSTQTHTPHQLVCIYLACAINTNWEHVYDEIDPVVELSILTYNGHKQGTNPALFARRQRDPSVFYNLFFGTRSV